MRELEELRSALGKKDMQLDAAHTRIADLQANVSDLRTSLRMLEPPKPTAPEQPPTEEPAQEKQVPPTVPPARPGFFRQLFKRRHG